MKVCYPFRNTNGQAFSNLDEVIRLITGEAHGTWLLGTNGLWHGGIHISDISAPFSAFNPDAVNTGDPVPLQFMTDGTLVAYRVNDDYLNSPYCGRSLRYSSTFALVKSVCKPDPEKEATWLEFYSLYMHLAPVADYPLSPCYKVNDGHSNITLRQYIRGQYGAAEGEQDVAGSAAPHPIAKKLKSGDRVVVSCTGRFYVSQHHQSVLMTFGLARQVDGNKMGDEQFWVTLDPELLVPDGEIAELMPEWMHLAQEKGTFNEVVVTDGSDRWRVAAGAPLGFLGCMESPGTGAIIAEKEWYAHLEVLSVDPGMQNFLANAQSVTAGKQYVIAQKGQALSIRCGEAGNYTFKEGTAKLGQQVIVSRDEADPTQDPSGKWWFNIMGGGWLPQEDITEAGQYDLMKLGFMPLEENSAGDQTDTPFESWVPEVFGQVSRTAEQGHSNQYSLVPQFYRDVLEKMGQDGKISGEEIRRALTIRDPLVRDVVSRMVVKHHSEWFGGRSTGRWDGFYKTLGQLETGYCEKWQADLEWMSKVPPFNQDSAIWHMHPVVFLDALRQTSTCLKGTLTYNAEGNNIPGSQFYSRVIHWPGNAESGVTLGRGYDMGSRSESAIYNDMITSGIDSTTAKKISLATGYKGSAANVFVSDNKVDIGEITEEQQINLFKLIYPGYVTRTIANYNAWTSEVATAKKWEQLDDVIKEVLVDFVYQGFTKGPNPMLAGANNDKVELINYIKNTPGISRYEPGRHRAKYLEGN